MVGAMFVSVVSFCAGVGFPLIVAGPSVVPEPTTTVASLTLYLVMRFLYELIVSPCEELGRSAGCDGNFTVKFEPAVAVFGAIAHTVMSCFCVTVPLPTFA